MPQSPLQGSVIWLALLKQIFLIRKLLSAMICRSMQSVTAYNIKINPFCPAENPPLPKGFAGLTVETLVLAPTLFQQLDMHFLAMNNTLNSTTMYIIFLGELHKHEHCLHGCMT